MNVIFVAGTDTGVGKTVVTGLLSHYLLEKGYRVTTQKWIATGHSDDIKMHLRFMGKTKEELKEYYSSMAPYSFKFAASPHLAAQCQGKTIRSIKIKKSLSALRRHFNFVIVEGIGGLMVPLNRERLLIDTIKELRMTVLLVAANRLGAINHTLLSIEALRKRAIRIIGIVFNNLLQNENKLILEDNPKIIEKLTGEVVLGVLPWVKDVRQLKKFFKPIGDKIIPYG